MSITSESAGAMRPWPADHIERWPIERLIPYANNARLHSAADLDKIAAAIRRWGWTMPVLVDEQGVLIAGHGRVGAAPRAGVTSIPVLVARGWSEEEKRAYRLADNQLAARASWDPHLLRNEIQELGFADFDLGLIGFEPDQLETILAGLGSSGLSDPDSVPEVPEQPVTQLGDLWLLGDHRVGCGDSTNSADVAQVLAGTEPHLMVTDPPYGVSYEPSWRLRRTLSRGKLAQGKVLNDDRADWREAYALFAGDVAYVWHGALHGDVIAANLAGCGLQPRAQIIWATQHCSLALRSSGPSNTSPWAAAITIGSMKPVGTRCATARSATGKATASRRRCGRSPTTTRGATRSASKAGGTGHRNPWSACVVRSPTTADRARRFMTRFSARGRA